MEPMTLDADLVFGGLWEGAPVHATRHDGETASGVVVERILSGTGWRVCGGSKTIAYDFVAHDDAPTVWTLSLRLPGHRGSALHVLTEAIKERVGVDSQGKVRAPASGATWRTTAEVADASNSGSVSRIMWASRYLVMTDALAAELGWPTGKGAPVWSWTVLRAMEKRWWSLSARASSKEGWSHEFSCDLTDPMAALEDVWRARGGDRSLRK